MSLLSRLNALGSLLTPGSVKRLRNSMTAPGNAPESPATHTSLCPLAHTSPPAKQGQGIPHYRAYDGGKSSSFFKRLWDVQTRRVYTCSSSKGLRHFGVKPAGWMFRSVRGTLSIHTKHSCASNLLTLSSNASTAPLLCWERQQTLPNTRRSRGLSHRCGPPAAACVRSRHGDHYSVKSRHLAIS